MEIIYFEVNDWSAGRDFPDCEPFNTWLSIDNLTFRKKQWLIENKIIVVETIIDMSLNYCVTAPKEWVEKNGIDKKTLFIDETTSLDVKDFKAFITERRKGLIAYLKKTIGRN